MDNHCGSAVRVIYSDASGTGYGGYVVNHSKYIVNGTWSQVEMVKSSTWRELIAVRRVLQTIADKLVGFRVSWHTDNQNVARMLSVGSKKIELQEEVIAVFQLCTAYHITLELQWVPRSQNLIADALSRIVDRDDWQLNPMVFQTIDAWWGPHTVDRFASYDNAQLNRFNSRFAEVGSEAVDTFTVDWNGENNWWCPPLFLVLRVLGHARECKAVGTIIVPLWQSAVYWPMLWSVKNGFAEFVVALF